MHVFQRQRETARLVVAAVAAVAAVNEICSQACIESRGIGPRREIDIRNVSATIEYDWHRSDHQYQTEKYRLDLRMNLRCKKRIYDCKSL